MIDGVVGDRERAVAALIPNLEAEGEHVFLAHLNVVGDFLAAGFFTPAAFINGEVGVDQFAMVLEQPVDSVVRSAAFFIGGEGDDDVAVRLKAFALVADQVGDPDGACALSSLVPRP